MEYAIENIRTVDECNTILTLVGTHNEGVKSKINTAEEKFRYTESRYGLTAVKFLEWQLGISVLKNKYAEHEKLLQLIRERKMELEA